MRLKVSPQELSWKKNDPTISENSKENINYQLLVRHECFCRCY